MQKFFFSATKFFLQQYLFCVSNFQSHRNSLIDFFEIACRAFLVLCVNKLQECPCKIFLNSCRQFCNYLRFKILKILNCILSYTKIRSNHLTNWLFCFLKKIIPDQPRLSQVRPESVLVHKIKFFKHLKFFRALKIFSCT